MAKFTEKSGFQKLIHIAYGLGAALVIIGALFKIQHWPGSGVMLTIGMMTEFFVFILSAFESMPKKYNWENVYPELLGNEKTSFSSRPIGSSVSSGASLDLGISAGQVSNIQGGVEKLSSSIDNLNALAAVAEESQKLTTNLINANQAVNAITTTSAGLSDTYKATTQIINNLNVESQKGVENMKAVSNIYGEQIPVLHKNMSAVNSSFELQLADNQQYQKAYKELNREMTSLVGDVKKTVEVSAAMSNQMSSLSENISKLNEVYGSVLTSITNLR